MSVKVKLLKYFKWKSNNLSDNVDHLPFKGLWITISIHNIGDKNQYHKMKCVMPDEPKDCGKLLNVHTKIIEDLMDEMVIIKADE